MHKYKPQTKEELIKLVQNENIYLGDIDTSLIINMSELFKESKRLDFSGIETWDTSNVIDMHDMFFNCRKFNSDISKWNVYNIENMACMFFGNEEFNQYIGDWNVSNVKDMNSIFLIVKNLISH